jgi:hypothetical protein
MHWDDLDPEEDQQSAAQDIVRQWLRVNGYTDAMLNQCQWSAAPVIPWTNTMASHPAIHQG